MNHPTHTRQQQRSAGLTPAAQKGTMTTELATTHGTSLTITENQVAFTDDQEATLRHAGVATNSRADLAVFFHQCKRTGLDPFAKQIYMITRQGKPTIQTGIDGFRLIARRATDATNGTLGYKPTLWMNDDGRWLEVWPYDTAPIAAKVTVIRNGGEFPAIAMFQEYAGRKKGGELNQMWSTRKAGMLAKCAEALALRMAFPQDLSGLYTSDEMQQADNPDVINHAPRRQPAQTQRQEPAPVRSESPAQSAADRLGSALGATPANTKTVAEWAALVDAAQTQDELTALSRDAQKNPEWSSDIKARFTTRKNQIAEQEAIASQVEDVDGEIVQDGDAA